MNKQNDSIKQDSSKNRDVSTTKSSGANRRDGAKPDIRTKRSDRTKRLAADALLICVAFVLSWLEQFIMIPVPVPGIKLGLGNLAILFAIYYCGIKDGSMVLTGKLLLSALLFGSTFSLMFSIAGGVLSFVSMAVCKHFFGGRVIFVSVIGGVTHNIGQLFVASIVMNTSLWPYVPYLVLGGLAAGLINGIIINLVLKSRAFI